MKHGFLFLCFLLVASSAYTQVGGNSTFQFLTLAPSARITSMGGYLTAVKDADVTLGLHNPALLNEGMHQQLSFNHSFFPGSIQYGYAAYGHHSKKLEATFHGSVQYVNYGTIMATNEYEEELAEFSPAEYGITVGVGKQLYERLHVGANLKLATAQFERYNSTGLALDLGAFYQISERNLAFALTLQNLGAQINTYRLDNREKLPYEANLAMVKRLKHLPFQFSITYRFLNRWNLLYDDPNELEPTIFLGESQQSQGLSPFFDNLSRHFVLGGEFLLGKHENLRIRFGYNRLRGQELSVQNYRSLTGFSLGFGVKIYHFRLDYGRSIYHLGGAVNFFSISTKLSNFSHKKMLDLPES